MKNNPDKNPITVKDNVCITQEGIDVPGGDSGSSKNLTLSNGHMILRFASDQKPPWGIPPGGIIDAAAVVHGKPKEDLITFFDFLPDNWSGWPNSYHLIDVIENGPEKGIIRVQRDWGDTRLSTLYCLHQNCSTVKITTTMTNKGDTVLKDIYPGYTLYPKNGHMLSPPGLNGKKKGDVQKALYKTFIGYSKNRAIALHVPDCNYIDHFGQDMLAKTTLQPKESRTMTAFLQICPDSNISDILMLGKSKSRSSKGKIKGRVNDNTGNPVQTPFIVVKKQGHVVAWCKGFQGIYSMVLPKGEYCIYAVAKNYSPSKHETVSIDRDCRIHKDFSGLKPPGEINFKITSSKNDKPLDAKITIKKGLVPEIGFLGMSDYFTELEKQGNADIKLSPGEYLFQVSHSKGFTATAKQVQLNVKSDEKQKVNLSVDQAITPRELNWYATDLHHHGDVLDGVTPPGYVLRSQLAAGLDFAFLSDHDSSEKNYKMAELAAKRECLFIPGMEISPAWGHFNIFPVNSEERMKIEPGESTTAEIFKESRRMGAKIIQVNHPYSSYGYFRNLDLDLAPESRLDPGFDLVELNFQYPARQAVEKVWDLWNQGFTCCLGAGTDTHSVWQDVSGSSRMYVFLEEHPTLEGLTDALKSGHSYVSFGPLVFPEIMFGSKISVQAHEKLNLKFKLFAVDKIKKANLICNGKNQESLKKFESAISCDIEFSTFPAQDCWYALVVEDQSGKSAYTNPIWVKCC